MKNNSKSQSTGQLNTYALWKYLVILCVLTVMTISALPNLYQSTNLSQADAPIDNQTTAMPLWLQKLGAKPMKLGLDLSGGVLFVLDVDIAEANAVRIQQAIDTIKTALRENNIRGVKVTQSSSGNNARHININYTISADISVLKNHIRQLFPAVNILNDGSQALKVFWSEDQQMLFQQEVMTQTLTTMRNRIEELGITEAVVQRQGKNRVRIELPGVSDPEEARAIIGATASLDFYPVQSAGGKAFTTGSGETVSVSSRPVFTGDHIQNAQSGRDEMGLPLVNLTLDSLGGKKMSDFSAKNIGEPMVTVFSEYYQDAKGKTVKTSKVISIATIQSQLGSRFSITNMPSPQKANELAMLLRAGSLVAPVAITKEQTINATLGATNIDNGFSALILGIALTLAFMVLWYKKLGIIANIALLFNIVCLFGLMSLLPGAVLTLPGIAGLVLTIGMAVDTNVLIFERIKEETQRGRSQALAIHQGYKNAFATILDANITTLLTALILYSIGYGPVRGFAITLGLGILSSMFTGIFVSRGLTNLTFRNLTAKQKGANA